MPQKYTHCVDCGIEKTTYSQQLSPRCNSCSGKKKRADKGEYYTHCIDCGVEKPLGTSRRHPRCLECGYKHLTNRPFFDACQECGEPKKRTKNRLCYSCAAKKKWNGKRLETYPVCQECGQEKADTTKEMCHSCSTALAWDTKRERIRVLYDTCQECGKEKTKNDRELCLSCAGIKRMTELYPDTDREYPYGWSKNFREEIRDRDGRKCQLCWITEKENGRRLDVHHIDYDKSNLDPDNLVSLCMSCHPKTNWNQSYWLQAFTKYRGRSLKQDWQRKVVVTAVKGGLSLAA